MFGVCRAGMGAARARAAATRIAGFRGCGSPFSAASGVRYASIRPRKEPRIRYLFYVFLASTATILFAGASVQKKKPKTSFSSENELNEYEQITGIRRRTRLIPDKDTEKYRFFGVPFVSRDGDIDAMAQSLAPTKVKVIDPQELVEREKKDETRKYCFLLQDLESAGKAIPKGLITALVKEEVSFYLNTSQGIYDTDFILKNYPQNTYEASKFENDIANIDRIVVLKDDLDKLPEAKSDEDSRLIKNVVYYFDAVGKTNFLSSPKDAWK